MKEIKVKVVLTDGYEKRFTEACLKQLRTSSKTKKADQKTKEN